MSLRLWFSKLYSKTVCHSFKAQLFAFISVSGDLPDSSRTGNSMYVFPAAVPVSSLVTCCGEAFLWHSASETPLSHSAACLHLSPSPCCLLNSHHLLYQVLMNLVHLDDDVRRTKNSSPCAVSLLLLLKVRNSREASTGLKWALCSWQNPCSHDVNQQEHKPQRSLHTQPCLALFSFAKSTLLA